MSHAFNGQSLAQLASNLRHLVQRAREHEHRLTDLVMVVENGHPSPPFDANAAAVARGPADVGLMVSAPSDPSPLLSVVRALCIAGREQRQLAESIADSMFGELVNGAGTEPARRHVLVVDDSDDSRQLAGDLLEADGFHVSTAANGLEAVLSAHSRIPDAIVMDINMPVLDGIEAARLLKATPVTHGVKVIAYTAKADFYEGPLTRLFVDVLAKPASPDAITARVRRLVDGSGR